MVEEPADEQKNKNTHLIVTQLMLQSLSLIQVNDSRRMLNRKCKPAVPSMAHRRLQHIPSLNSQHSPFITFEIWLILHSISEFTLMRNLGQQAY